MRKTAIILATMLGMAPLAAHASNPNISLSGAVKVADAPLGVKMPSSLKSPSSPGAVATRDKRMSVTGSNLYGFMAYPATETTPIGWYSLTLDGKYQHLWTNETAHTYYPMKCGWVRDGKLCGITSYEVFGMVLTYTYDELNLTDGSTILTRSVPLSSTDLSGYFTNATYNPVDGKVYGYGKTKDGRADAFKSASADFTSFEILKIVNTEEICPSLTWDAQESRLVGINNRGELVEINTKDASQKILMKTDIPDWRPFLTGLAFSPVDDCFLWNAMTYNNGFEGSYIYALCPQDNTAQCINEFGQGEEFTFFYTPDKAVAKDAPARPEVAGQSFVGAALQGSVSYILPTKLRDGASISGALKWKAAVDGKEVSQGSGTAGEKVTVNFENLSTGMHVFTLAAVKDGKEGLPAALSIWVGNDNPEIPADVALDGSTLTWKAVEKGAHSGYMDKSNVSYEISLNGVVQGTTSDTKYEVKYPEGTQVANYQASVRAVCNGMYSEPGYSNSVIRGDAMTLPFTIVPTLEQEKIITTEDTDGDGTGWTGMEYDDIRVFMSGIKITGNAEDWLFLPKFALTDKSKVISVALEAALVDAGFPDGNLKIALGTAANSKAMKHIIADSISLKSQTFKPLEYLFTIPDSLKSSDEYYIGICAYTPADKIYAAYIKNITLSLSDLNPDAPGIVKNLTAQAGERGALNAKVSFSFPTSTVAGVPLASDEYLEAQVTGADIVKVTGHPGEACSVEVPTIQGDNSIGVQVNRKVGAQTVSGMVESIELFTGVAIPGLVGSLEGNVTEDNFGVELRWTPPTESVNGGWFDPEAVEYTLCTPGETSWIPVVNLGKNITEYTYTMPAGTQLQNKYFGIVTSNSAGMNESLRALLFEIGKPLVLPLSEEFPDGKATLAPLTMATSSAYSKGKWMISDPGVFKDMLADGGKSALIGYPTGQNCQGKISLPKFSTKGMKDGRLSMRVWTGEDAANVRVMAESFGMAEAVEIGSFGCTGSGYSSITFDIPDSLMNRDWVSVSLVANYTASKQQVVVTRYAVGATSGLNEVSSDAGEMNIYPQAGGIVVNGHGAISVFTVEGRKAWTGYIDGSKYISLSSGVYLITNGKNICHKILVR